MRRLGRITAALVCLAGGFWPATGSAQLTTDAAGLRVIAGGMLENGLPQDALLLAGALLQRDPGDVAALLILAEASILIEDNEAAITAATSAYPLAEGGQRYGAARLAALGHARMGRYTIAQIWLRRARQAAPNAEAARAVAADYRVLRDRNPLNVQLIFGISPSSNINGGSASETITLPGLPFEFVLDGEARALAGIQFSGGAALTYRLRADEVSSTNANLQLQGRTYALTDAARAQAPDARGADYADVYLAAGVTHRWQAESGSDVVKSVSATLGQTWYGGDPYSRFLTLSHEHDRALSDRQRLMLEGFAEWSGRLGEDDPYATLGGRARLTMIGETGNRTTLSLTLREAMTDQFDVGFQGATVTAGYDLREPVAGVRIGFGADLDYRFFENSAYSFDPREDLRTVLRVTAGLPRITFYGFEPLVTFEASNTQSNIPLFEKSDLRINLGLRSSF
jgi:hypothetical protein